jgi:hypothetical protein
MSGSPSLQLDRPQSQPHKRSCRWESAENWPGTLHTAKHVRSLTHVAKVETAGLACGCVNCPFKSSTLVCGQEGQARFGTRTCQAVQACRRSVLKARYTNAAAAGRALRIGRAHCMPPSMSAACLMSQTWRLQVWHVDARTVYSRLPHWYVDRKVDPCRGPARARQSKPAAGPSSKPATQVQLPLGAR